MNTIFANYLERKKQLAQKHQQENEKQERQFWLDPAIAHNIPRPVYSINYERYFGALMQRHVAEMAKLDSEYLNGYATVPLPGSDNEIVTEEETMNMAAPQKLNDAEMRYANMLKEEYAKNNMAKDKQEKEEAK